MNSRELPPSLKRLFAATAVGLLLASGSAQAQSTGGGGGGLPIGTVSNFTVTPVIGQVSYSQSGISLYSLAGYEFKVTNSGTGPLTATFTGTLSNSLLAGQTGTFYNNTFTESSNCSTTAAAATTVVTCTSLQVPAGTTLTRVVYYRVANKLSTNTLQPGGLNCSNTTGDCLTFTGQLTVAASLSQQGYSNTITTKIGQGAPAITNFHTAVPSKGLSFWTGTGSLGATNSTTDRATTRVTVPITTMTVNGLAGYTRASIVEANYVTGDPQCVNFTTCVKTDITLPVPAARTGGVYPTTTPLNIVLKRNRSNATTTNVNNVILSYTPDGSTQRINLGVCPSSTTARTDGIPCIRARASSKTEFTFTLVNIKNGRYWVD